MLVTQYPVDRLIPYARNSRTHSDAQVAQIAASIKEFGWTNPVLIDEQGGVIAGHGRILAARKLGYTEIPTIALTGLTEAQKRAYIIADNKLALNAGWDDAMLLVELDDLKLAGFDLELTGFSLDEISALSPEQIPEGLTDEDYVPEVQPDPVSKLGDVWLLGKHRVMCGDSTSVHDLDRLMAGSRADITFTSPPYNAAKNGHLTGNVAGFDKKYQNHSDDMSDDDYFELLHGFTSLALTVSRYVFVNLQLLTHNRAPLFRYQAALQDQIKDILIWDKSQCPPNIVKGAFNTRWEYVFCFSDDVKTRGFPCTWQGQHPNVVETESNSANAYAADHKAGFPVALPTWFLERLDFVSSVYEPFCGTGTTLIASEQFGKICFGMELDGKYVDVIVKRWQEFTGKSAILESNGRSFSELSES